MSAPSITTPDAPNTWLTSTADASWISRIARFGIRWRVPLSTVVFALLVVVDLFVLKTRPLDLKDVSNPWVVAGETLVVLGLLLRAWAAGTLHKIKTLTTTGPYALVRNPLYVGSFLMMYGFCLLMADWRAFLFVVGPFGLLYWVKVREEEILLAHLFGDAWTKYTAATPRFIPWPRAISFTTWSLAQWIKNQEYQALVASALGLIGLLLWYQFTSP